MIRFQFDVSPLDIAKWMGAALLGAAFIFPFAWVIAAAARWAASRIRMSDGTTVEFRGDGADIAVWTVLALGLPAAFFLVLGPGGVLSAATLVLWLGAAFMIAKWLIYNTHLSTGPQLTLDAGFLPLMMHSALAKAGFLSSHQWLVSQIKGEAIAFSFDAPSSEVFWRSWATLAAIVTIIGAPWALAAHGRWWFAHLIFERGVDTSTWQLKDESPRRISSPGGFGG